MNQAAAGLTLALSLAASAVAAQTLPDLDRAEAGLTAVWTKTPLLVRRALFVAERPEGFGIYQERASNLFKSGETLITYAEPLGYGWNDVGNGQVEFGFSVDFLVKGTDGKLLAGQENFARLVKRSHNRNREFMLTLSLDLDGAPPGDYIVEYKLHDIASDKTTSFEQPFKIGT
jgi:hypothetical protein